LKSFATIDPNNLSEQTKGFNLVGGEWLHDTEHTHKLIDPMNKNKFLITQPDTSADEVKPFIDHLKSCPKHGLHNPIKNPERYVMMGEIC